MFLRIDKLQVELPQPSEADPNAAAAVQELLGGRFGEMSTLMNYMYQSFNFRGKGKLKPYYDLIANIAAEELGHIELVSATINLLHEGAHDGDSADGWGEAKLAATKDFRNSYHFLSTAQTAFVGDSMGLKWSGEHVFSSGNLMLDLVHNFFLELGARTYKLRVYEMTDNPVAREMLGYLLVRGGVHAQAYAKALDTLSEGANVTKLLPIPKIDNSEFPEARKYMDQGFHRFIYRFSPDDYRDIGKIWNGPAVEDGQELEVIDGWPEGGDIPELSDKPAEFAPEADAQQITEIASRLLGKG